MAIRHLKNRLPASKDAFTVFSFVIFIVTSWCVYVSLPNLTSYLYHFNIIEILSIFFYLMAFALFESVLVTFVLIVIGFVLPSQWFSQGFAYKAPVPLLVVAVALMRLQESLSSGNIPPLRVFAGSVAVVLFLCAVLVFFFHRVRRLQTIMKIALERFELFTFIYVPLGLIGIVVMLIRNIFK